MPTVVQFAAPHQVALVREDNQPLRPGTVRIRTLHSGISAGTELTAYRGTNPLLDHTWDPVGRLFSTAPSPFAYPVTGWGYSEVGRVTEVSTDVEKPHVGEVVWGIWGHRSEAVLRADQLVSHEVPPDLSTLVGVFGRVGAVALNAVLAADIRLGEHVAVFGQGVIGLLATRLAVLSGAQVTALDTQQSRLDAATAMGAHATLNPAELGPDGSAHALRQENNRRGIDVAIELSGTYRALHEAIRGVGQGGTVIAAGFYQGGGSGLRLGEEFHHNRVHLVASQIGGVPAGLAPRWNTERVHLTFMGQVFAKMVDPVPLVTHRFPAAEVASAFELLDQGADALQVVLDFDESE